MLALVGIPLGIATRKGGKSAGYVIGLFLAFFCYYLSLISLIGLAKQRTLPVPVAVWLPDAVFGIAGIIFLARMELPGDRDLLGSAQALLARLKRSKPEARRSAPRFAGWRLPLLPQIVDTYILTQLPLLRAGGAGQLRFDDPGLQLLRAHGRHGPQQDPADEDVHLPVLPHAAADLFHAADQHPGGACW